MEHTATKFVYHDGLNHYDKEQWFDVEGFSGWAVVECNYKGTVEREMKYYYFKIGFELPSDKIANEVLDIISLITDLVRRLTGIEILHALEYEDKPNE
jgi:hypothetical protein